MNNSHDLRPPPGCRFLEAGEYTQADDLFWSFDDQEWKIVKPAMVGEQMGLRNITGTRYAFDRFGVRHARRVTDETTTTTTTNAGRDIPATGGEEAW